MFVALCEVLDRCGRVAVKWNPSVAVVGLTIRACPSLQGRSSTNKHATGENNRLTSKRAGWKRAEEGVSLEELNTDHPRRTADASGGCEWRTSGPWVDKRSFCGLNSTRMSSEFTLKRSELAAVHECWTKGVLRHEHCQRRKDFY